MPIIARLSVGKGVYFYTKGCVFKLNWQKGKEKGSVKGAKATGPEDEKACKVETPT